MHFQHLAGGYLLQRSILVVCVLLIKTLKVLLCLPVTSLAVCDSFPITGAASPFSFTFLSIRFLLCLVQKRLCSVLLLLPDDVRLLSVVCF